MITSKITSLPLLLFVLALVFVSHSQNQDIFAPQKPLSSKTGNNNTFGVNFKLSGDKSKLIILSGNELEIWGTNSKRIILKKQFEKEINITNFEINYTGNNYAIVKANPKDKTNNTISFHKINENKPFFKLPSEPNKPINTFTKIRFNKTGDKVAVVYKSKGVDIYQIENNILTLIKHLDFDTSPLIGINDFEFSDNDKYFYVFLANNFSSNKPIVYQKWSLNSYSLLESINSKTFKFNTTMILQAYSNLGHKTAASGWHLQQGLFVNCKYMQMHSTSKKNGNSDVNINPRHKSFIELYNAINGQVTNLLSHTTSFNEAIIADSETIVTSDQNKNIQIWNLKTGKLKHQLNTNAIIDSKDFDVPHLKRLSSIAIMVVDSKKTEIYYSLKGQSKIRIWNYKYNTNEIFESNLVKVDNPFFTSDSTIVYKKDVYLEHYDFKNQKTIKLTEENRLNKAFHFKYSKSSNKGVTKTNNTIKLWDIIKLLPVDSIQIPNSPFNTYFSSQDLSYLAVAISKDFTNATASLLKSKNKPVDHKKLMNDLMQNVINKTYKVDGSEVDPQNIKIKIYKTDNFIINETLEIDVPAFAIQKISFIQKSNKILISAFHLPIVNQTKNYKAHKNYIYDIAKKTLSELPKDMNGIGVLIPNTNNFIVFDKKNKTTIEVKVVDINSNTIINRFSIPIKNYLGNWKLDFINNNEIIVYGKYKNFLLNLSAKKLMPISEYDDFESFDVNYKKNFFVSTNGDLSFYSNSLDNKLFTKYFHKDGKSSITILPNNYYLNKGKGYELITLLKNDNAYSFEQFDLKYHRPDLVIEAMKDVISDKIFNSKDIYRLAYDKRLQRINKKEEELNSNFHTPEVLITNKAELPNKTNSPVFNINVKAFDSKYKLLKLQISINGILIKNQDFKLTQQNTSFKTIPLTLSNGKNKILISVTNNQGVSSPKEEINVEYTGENVTSNMFVVTLGVSKYQYLNNTPNSSKDAEKIIEIFKTKKTNVKSLCLTDNEVTQEKINQISNFLSKTKENDIIVFFVSGHALRDKNNYFFCTSNSKLDNIKNTGITYDDFDTLLGNTKSRNRLLILNTCYSGEVYDVNNLKEIEAANLMRNIFEDLKLTNGTTVISASEGTKKYYESSTQENGIITRAILNLAKTRTAIKAQSFCEAIIDYCTKTNDEDPFKNKIAKNTPLIRFNNIYNNFKIW